MRSTRAISIVWTMWAVVLVAIVVTYTRLAPEDLYDVTGRGFVAGGLSRAIVYVNFPVGLAAMILLLVQADRMSRAQRLLSLVALALWVPVFSPRVLSQSHLDARWSNTVPADAVALALVLTLSTPALRPDRVRGDAARVAFGTLLVLVALPWIAAELGFDFTHVAVLGQIFQTHELRHQPGTPGVHPAVHYGDHHGLEGTLLIITVLLTSRMLGAIRGRRLHAAFGFVCGLTIAYGVGNILNDFWTEQVVKRGWTTWQVPNVLEPRASWAWLLVLVGGVVLWLSLFKPRYPSRTIPRPASSSTSAAL